MGYGTVLLMIICIAFGVMLFAPNGNNSAAYYKIANATKTMQNIQSNSSVGGSTVGTFNLINTVQIAAGYAGFIGSLTGAVWDIFGSLAELPEVIKAFIIAVILLFLTVAAVSIWLGRNDI